MSKYVYSFGGGTADGDGTMKDILGGKGAGLAEMSRAGLPVPRRLHHRHQRLQYLFREQQTDSRRDPEGDRQSPREARKDRWARSWAMPSNPLLLSVRSGAKFSMPGMMNTILNLGLNDATTAGLADKSGNPRFAYDCYRRFIQMFGEVALDIEMEKFDHIFDARKAKVKAKLDTDLNADDLKAIIADYKKLVQKETKKPFPEDPREQLDLAVRRRVPLAGGTTRPTTTARWKRFRTISAPPPTCRPWCSATWATLPPPASASRAIPVQGEKVFYGEFLMNAQGEDVVAGIRTPQPISDLEKVLPEAFAQLVEITTNLEKHYKDMQDFEFTIQESKLYMLQTRNGKRTGPAAVRIAVDMVEEGMITKKEAILRVAPAQLDQLLHPVFDPKTLKELVKLTTGISASPGAAVGRVAFSAEDAVEMAASGPVLLVRKETTPDDIHGMDVAKGILTAIGGKSSHAAVVARGMGRPCVVGAGGIRIDEEKKDLHRAGRRQDRHREGRRLHFARWHHRRRLCSARPKPMEPNLAHASVGKFMGWTDEFRGKFGVRANADIPRDAKVARAVRRRRHRPLPHRAHVLRRRSPALRAGR